MNYCRIFGTIAALLLTCAFGRSASIITIAFDSGSATLNDNLGNPLSGGTTADGDGDVLQLGYYTNATVGNEFAGTWVPLSGEGSLNTGSITGSVPAEAYNQTSIGDQNAQGAGNGTYALSLTFTAGDPNTGNSLPIVPGMPLAIRFYNSTSVETSTLFNAVSDDSWLWETPGPAPLNPVLTLSLSDQGLLWQGGASTAFETALAVPEPASLSLALLGGVAMLVRRRGIGRLQAGGDGRRGAVPEQG